MGIEKKLFLSPSDFPLSEYTGMQKVLMTRKFHFHENFFPTLQNSTKFFTWAPRLLPAVQWISFSSHDTKWECNSLQIREKEKRRRRKIGKVIIKLAVIIFVLRNRREVESKSKSSFRMRIRNFPILHTPSLTSSQLCHISYISCGWKWKGKNLPFSFCHYHYHHTIDFSNTRMRFLVCELRSSFLTFPHRLLFHLFYFHLRLSPTFVHTASSSSNSQEIQSKFSQVSRTLSWMWWDERKFLGFHCCIFEHFPGTHVHPHLGL